MKQWYFGVVLGTIVGSIVALVSAQMTPILSGGSVPLTGGAGIVPANGILFTTDGACPTGYNAYTPMRGRYLVGTPAAGTNAGTQGTVLTDLESRATGIHNHGITDPGHNHTQNAHTHGVTDAGHSHPILKGHNGGTGGIFDSNENGSDNSVSGTPITPGTQSVTTGITINNQTPTNNANTTGITINNSAGVAGTNAPYIQLLACQKS